MFALEFRTAEEFPRILLSKRGPLMPNVYGWQRFYQQAILETDRKRLPRLIQSAQAAIDARIEQLGADHDGSSGEREAIANALAGLRVLRDEVARDEDQTQTQS